MSWQEYQNNDRREQEQLEIIRALIGDTAKGTTLWLQDDPSAEERVHVLAIQTGLADLARIVERRMERRKLPKDEWEYSETVSEVLSRLEKARKLRGNIIVGRGLGRLTERLPQELPGAKARGVTQAPAPPHDWHEELRRARNMEDDFGFLTFGHAWDAVRQLAQTNDAIDQEKRIDGIWRMYPEAAEKLGLPKLPASEVKPAASSSVESRADRWRTFRNEFEQLAREERPGMTPRNRREWTMMLRADGLLYASVSYRKHPEGWPIGKPGQGLISLVKTPECGLWIVAGSVRENFQERFRALAARAGVALAERFQPAQSGSPKDTEPEDFWLHQLFLDLRENNSDHLFAVSDEGGRILHVCEASATFCARLERKVLETNGAEERSSADTAEGKPTYRRLEGGAMSWRREIFLRDYSEAESSRAQNSATSAQDVESKSPIGRNIDRFRKECGWSFDDLVGKTGIDKKNILAHVNEGRKPRPRTMKEYAQAFSKALQQEITVADLEK